MKNLSKLKILIVGLTSVLALTNINKSDIKNGLVKNDWSINTLVNQV